jgi:hypothetical protein
MDSYNIKEKVWDSVRIPLLPIAPEILVKYRNGKSKKIEGNLHLGCENYKSCSVFYKI